MKKITKNKILLVIVVLVVLGGILYIFNLIAGTIAFIFEHWLFFIIVIVASYFGYQKYKERKI